MEALGIGGAKGPTTQRADVPTAPIPGLTPQIEQMLGGFLQNPQAIVNQFQPTSQLNQQTGNFFQQLLGGFTGGETGGVLGDLISGGQGVIDEAQPIFQRNLQQSLQRQREFGGPRFAAESGRQAGQLEQQSLQDFNLFQQQVLESGRNRQQQLLLGGLGGASQFGLGQSGQQNQLTQQLLGQAFSGGTGAPVITSGPNAFTQIGGAATQFAGAGLGGK